MRIAFRRESLVAVAFTVLLAGLNALTPPHAVNGIIGTLYFGSAAFVIVRWGLLPLAIGTFVQSVLFDIAGTTDMSAWYFGNNLLLVGIVLALALWGFWKAVPRDVHMNAVRPGYEVHTG